MIVKMTYPIAFDSFIIAVAILKTVNGARNAMCHFICRYYRCRCACDVYK